MVLLLNHHIISNFNISIIFYGYHSTMSTIEIERLLQLKLFLNWVSLGAALSLGPLWWCLNVLLLPLLPSHYISLIALLSRFSLYWWWEFHIRLYKLWIQIITRRSKLTEETQGGVTKGVMPAIFEARQAVFCVWIVRLARCPFFFLDSSISQSIPLPFTFWWLMPSDPMNSSPTFLNWKSHGWKLLVTLKRNLPS